MLSRWLHVTSSCGNMATRHYLEKAQGHWSCVLQRTHQADWDWCIDDGEMESFERSLTHHYIQTDLLLSKVGRGLGQCLKKGWIPLKVLLWRFILCSRNFQVAFIYLYLCVHE